MMMQTQYLLQTLRFALLTTVAFLVLLLFEFSWRTALLAGLTLSVILSLTRHLVRPKHGPEISSFQTIATISSLIGYWLILYSLIATYTDGYHPAVLAFGAIAFLVPLVATWLKGPDRRHGDDDDDDDFVRGNSKYSLKKNKNNKSRGGGKGRDYPKPQIVSVVYNWNWVNLLIVVLGVIPAFVFGLVYVVNYGPGAIIEGIAVGAALSSLGLLYVVWNN